MNIYKIFKNNKNYSKKNIIILKNCKLLLVQKLQVDKFITVDSP